MNTGAAPGEKAHILVVDDDARLRALLQRFLSNAGYRVTAAEDAAKARGLLASIEYDLLVLDVMMPGESGFDLTSSLRETMQVPVLLLTARGEPEDRIEGLERGADDYLAKPFEPRELLLRVGALLRRVRAERPPDPIVRLGAARFDAERGELTVSGKPVKLTTVEQALLRALARQTGRPMSRTDLARVSNAGAERSVDVQITRLRRKIETDPKMPLYLQTVRGIGYVLVPDRVD